MIPYIYLNLRGGSSLSHGIQWTFPTVRAVGGFLTATMMQLTIQRRITTLCRRWLSKHDRGKTGTGSRRIDVLGLDQSGGASGCASDLERGLESTGASCKTRRCELLKTLQMTGEKRHRQRWIHLHGRALTARQITKTMAPGVKDRDVEIAKTPT